jgi:hypothetical protein
MASMTYYVALAFMHSEGGDIVACEPKEARNSNQAIRMADSLATTEGHCGAIAFSRTGDPALGDFVDAVILKTVGEVDSGLASRQCRSPYRHALRLRVAFRSDHSTEICDCLPLISPRSATGLFAD